LKNIQAKTGKTLDSARQHPPRKRLATHGELRDFAKRELGWATATRTRSSTTVLKSDGASAAAASGASA